jgi:small subunit ribosomal protein S6e
MKVNIANPSAGMQKVFEIEDDKKLLPFYDKRMAAEVPGDSLGDEFKGYVFKISGGNDKQGFPMKQGILRNQRVRLLFKKGMSCYRERRTGCRKRKSARGCIVGPDLAIMNLVIARKGPEEIPGLTDDSKPRRLGPKRAANIRKLFNLEKKDDVKQFVVRRTVKEGNKKQKAPRIQRLVTSSMLQRKRFFRSQTRKKMVAAKQLKADYAKRLSEYRQEQKELRAAEVAKKKKEKSK